MRKNPPAASAATIHSTDGSRTVWTTSATRRAGTMIRFGTTRRSRSVTVTATSTAQASESTSASTETPNVVMQAATSAAKTTTAMSRRRLVTSMLRSWCRRQILPVASLDRGTPASEQDGARDGRDQDDRPRRQESQQQEQQHDDDGIPCVV